MVVDFAQIQISTVPSVDSFVKLVMNSTEIKNESVKVKFLDFFKKKIFFSNFFQIFSSQ